MFEEFDGVVGGILAAVGIRLTMIFAVKAVEDKASAGTEVEAAKKAGKTQKVEVSHLHRALAGFGGFTLGMVITYTAGLVIPLGLGLLSLAYCLAEVGKYYRSAVWVKANTTSDTVVAA